MKVLSKIGQAIRWIWSLSWFGTMGWLYWGIGMIHWSDDGSGGLFWLGMIGALIAWGFQRLEVKADKLITKLDHLENLESRIDDLYEDK